ncbi:hypothetical protein GGX14DRAFT_403624 [Mycena pura]|uniref:Uncharacterized protein n=1 Tax=Mycena pura TaxID=153505 RepID=A0AAD6UXD5_9AGAR|nr:hypothetical protein GGX14DRAFT_403624 [Mycena pura]
MSGLSRGCWAFQRDIKDSDLEDHWQREYDLHRDLTKQRATLDEQIHNKPGTSSTSEINQSIISGEAFRSEEIGGQWVWTVRADWVLHFKITGYAACRPYGFMGFIERLFFEFPAKMPRLQDGGHLPHNSAYLSQHRPRLPLHPLPLAAAADVNVKTGAKFAKKNKGWSRVRVNPAGFRVGSARVRVRVPILIDPKPFGYNTGDKPSRHASADVIRSIRTTRGQPVDPRVWVRVFRVRVRVDCFIPGPGPVTIPRALTMFPQYVARAAPRAEHMRATSAARQRCHECGNVVTGGDGVIPAVGFRLRGP